MRRRTDKTKMVFGATRYLLPVQVGTFTRVKTKQGKYILLGYVIVGGNRGVSARLEPVAGSEMHYRLMAMIPCEDTTLALQEIPKNFPGSKVGRMAKDAGLEVEKEEDTLFPEDEVAVQDGDITDIRE